MQLRTAHPTPAAAAPHHQKHVHHTSTHQRCSVACASAGGGGDKQAFGAALNDMGKPVLAGPKLVLGDAERRRLDESPDAQFYATPRMMQHADEACLDALRRVYRSVIPAGACVLELCASHSSHLPAELAPRLLVGQGMNAQELAANTSLHEWFVQDLNLLPELDEQLDASFDAVLCVNGLQYLTQPETVLAEACRVLRPGGICIIAFSSDCFQAKATAAWLSRSMQERSELVARLLQANSFDEPMVTGGQGGGAAGQAAMCVLAASKPKFWSGGAAQADTATGLDMRADNVQQWFTKPGLAGLSEAAAGSPPAAPSTQQQRSSSSSSEAAGGGRGAGVPAAPLQEDVDERLLQQWRGAYESLVVDAVDMGIPRSVIPVLQPGASPLEIQEAVQHLQAMMASFMSAGL